MMWSSDGIGVSGAAISGTRIVMLLITRITVPDADRVFAEEVFRNDKSGAPSRTDEVPDLG